MVEILRRHFFQRLMDHTRDRQARNHLLSAGTTYHGAQSVLVWLNMSS
jgi:hypothetical protein